MIEKYTYGCSPAALYLVHQLNEINNKNLTRKVGKTITAVSTQLTELQNAHDKKTISLQTFARMVEMIDSDVKAVQIKKIEAIDPFIAHLALNVIASQIKSLKARLTVGAHSHRQVQRRTPPGTSVPPAEIYQFHVGKHHQDAIDRSKQYLARKNKPCTLY